MRFAAYCRVSTDSSEQLSSLQNQRIFFEEYALRTGDKLIKIYADEGISGKDMKKRDAFLQMLSDGQNHCFDYLAVKDISRFARNTSDFLFGIRTLKSHGIDVRFLSNNQTVLGESEFVLTVFAALAQQESENLSKRVIFGKNQNAKKGRVPNVIYGYDKADMYTLTINPQESEIVRFIFSQYINGEGTRRIAIQLNEMGIPTKKNSLWTAKTIRRILQNPVYTGRLINHKSVTQDFLSGTRTALPENEWYIHEKPELQLISSQDFMLVQSIIKKRQELYKRNERHSGKHLFSNLIQCGECKKSFIAKTVSGSVKYICSTHKNSASLCPNRSSVNEKALLDEIVKYILSEIADENMIIKKATENLPAYTQDTLKHLEKRKLKFREMFTADLITLDELKAELDKIDNAITKAKAKLNIDNSPSAKSIGDLLSAAQFTNADIRQLVDKIIIYNDFAEIFIKTF